MALIKCPECGKEISDKAVYCINCGFPIAEINKNQPAKEETKKVEEKPKAQSKKSSGLMGIDYNLEQLFNEMDESYQAMIKAANISETIVKQNMVTMRACLENLLKFIVETTGLSEEHIRAAVTVKTGKTENINPTDIYSRIVALSYYGFVPASIEKTMHAVRGAGNDAAHYSAFDDGKPNSLRGKTANEMRNIATAMYSNLDDVKEFLIENYDRIRKSAEKSKNGSPVKAKGKSGNKTNSGKLILAFILIFALVAGGIFAFDYFSKEAAKDAQQKAKTTALKTLSTHTKEKLAYSVKISNNKNFNADKTKANMRNDIVKNPEMNYLTLSKGKQKTFNDYPNALDNICYTSDASVADVNWSGTITAVGEGSCHVVIYDNSTGRYRVVLISVK